MESRERSTFFRSFVIEVQKTDAIGCEKSSHTNVRTPDEMEKSRLLRLKRTYVRFFVPFSVTAHSPFHLLNNHFNFLLLYGFCTSSVLFALALRSIRRSRIMNDRNELEKFKFFALGSLWLVNAI